MFPRNDTGPGQVGFQFSTFMSPLLSQYFGFNMPDAALYAILASDFAEVLSNTLVLESETYFEAFWLAVISYFSTCRNFHGLNSSLELNFLNLAANR